MSNDIISVTSSKLRHIVCSTFVLSCFFNHSSLMKATSPIHLYLGHSAHDIVSCALTSFIISFYAALASRNLGLTLAKRSLSQNNMT